MAKFLNIAKRVIVAIWKFCSYLFVPRRANRLPNDD